MGTWRLPLTRDERVELLARIARGDEREEKVGKEGPYEVSPSIRDRLAALRMLAELDGDIERAKRAAAAPAGDDRWAAMSERQLRLELGLEESDGDEAE